jgi:hypothetical protein
MSVKLRRAVDDRRWVVLEPDHPLHAIVKRAQNAGFDPSLGVVQRIAERNRQRAAQ